MNDDIYVSVRLIRVLSVMMILMFLQPVFYCTTALLWLETDILTLLKFVKNSFANGVLTKKVDVFRLHREYLCTVFVDL